jgi:hypothetical protein
MVSFGSATLFVAVTGQWFGCVSREPKDQGNFRACRPPRRPAPGLSKGHKKVRQSERNFAQFP